MKKGGGPRKRPSADRRDPVQRNFRSRDVGLAVTFQRVAICGCAILRSAARSSRTIHHELDVPPCVVVAAHALAAGHASQVCGAVCALLLLAFVSRFLVLARLRLRLRRRRPGACGTPVPSLRSSRGRQWQLFWHVAGRSSLGACRMVRGSWPASAGGMSRVMDPSIGVLPAVNALCGSRVVVQAAARGAFVDHWVSVGQSFCRCRRQATYNTDLIQGIKAMRVIQKALTFDDVLLIPAHSSVLPRDVSLQTKVTRNITLNIPLVSAAMDTVTEAASPSRSRRKAGSAIVHKNLTPAQQAPRWPRSNALNRASSRIRSPSRRP
jgi:hypothetical protein